MGSLTMHLAVRGPLSAERTDFRWELSEMMLGPCDFWGGFIVYPRANDYNDYVDAAADNIDNTLQTFEFVNFNSEINLDVGEGSRARNLMCFKTSEGKH